MSGNPRTTSNGGTGLSVCDVTGGGLGSFAKTRKSGRSHKGNSPRRWTRLAPRARDRAMKRGPEVREPGGVGEGDNQRTKRKDEKGNIREERLEKAKDATSKQGMGNHKKKAVYAA